MTNNRRNPTGAALASLAAAAGLLVGLRSIASFELPRPATLLGIEPMAREGLGVLWSGQAAWPAEFQAVGLERLVQVLVLGADDLPREALYLSALQKPMHSGQLLLRGEQSAVDAVYGQMALGGFSPGEPRTLTQFRAGETVVLPWIRMVAVILSGVVLLLAMHGVHVTALQVTRRRWRELAIRRAVGAGRGRVIAHVVGEHVRVGLWGVAGMVFWGTMVVAVLRKAAGMDALGPLPYVVIGGWLGGPGGGFVDRGGAGGAGGGAGGGGGLAGAGFITYALAKGAPPETLPSSRVFELRIRPHTYALPETRQESLHDHPDS